MREVKVGKKYRHFKGHDVLILHLGKHSESLENMVIYRHLDTNEIWVRPYDMFISEVDHEKYPEVKQKSRFEEVDD